MTLSHFMSLWYCTKQEKKTALEEGYQQQAKLRVTHHSNIMHTVESCDDCYEGIEHQWKLTGVGL